MGIRENGAKVRVVQKYSRTHLCIKLNEGIYDLEDHDGEEALSLNLLPKLEPTKKIPPTSFLSHMLENI